MAESVTETLLGAGVLVVAAGFVVFAGQSADLGTGVGDGRYPLTARFQSVEGISPGTDVKMAGVRIGSVRSMELNPETYLAEIEVTVRDDILIPDDSDIKITSEGLLGGSFVEIAPGGSPVMLESGEEILLTQSAVSFLNLMMRFVTADNEAPPE